MKLIIAVLYFNPPSLMPQTIEQASYYENLPPWNICNILFILILCCGLCPCSLSHHSVRWFVVDFMRTVFGHRKNKMFSSFTLLLVFVYDVMWVLLRRYVVTIVIRQRVTTHLGLQHPEVVPFALFHL